MEYNNKLKQYKPTHPVMLRLQQEIETTKQNIEFESEIARRRLQARFEALRIQEDALDRITSGWQVDKSLDLSIAQQSEHDSLQREVARLSKLVDKVANTIIDVSAQSSESLVTRLLLQPRSLGQVWPKTPIIILGSIGGSLGAGVLLALALFYFDTRFLDVIAVEQRLGLPFISGVPRWERVMHDFDPEKLIVMDKSKPNAASEAYRSLRISLGAHMEDKKGYSLLLTSADAGEGKSVTTANLGVSFSWTGRRVLLVDADLRRPNLHNVVGQRNPDKGLTQLLMGEVGDWRDIVHETGHENVHFMPAGKFVYEAAELCSPARLHEFMHEWSADYDMVILDSAPVGRIVDTAMIAKGCDGVILISLHGKSSFPSIRHALRRLQGCNVLGFILNAIDIPRGHTYYGGYSGYKWRYGLYSYYDYYSRSLYGYDAYYTAPSPDEEENGEEYDEEEDEEERAPEESA
jgi:capsular exopolysaccharide synthesis family protein